MGFCDFPNKHLHAFVKLTHIQLFPFKKEFLRAGAWPKLLIKRKTCSAYFVLVFCFYIHSYQFTKRATKFRRSFIKREWQRMTTSGTSDNEWQRVTKSGTSDEWYNEWQRMTKSGTSDKEWQRVIQRVTASDNKWQWQRVTAMVQRMKMVQHTSKNGWLLCFQWQKQIHYYFKGWLQLEWLNKKTFFKFFQEGN